MTAKTLRAVIAVGDPGTLICSHDNRIHALGGGIWVCFRCWARLLTGHDVQDKAGG